MSPRDSAPLAGPLIPLELQPDPAGLANGVTASIGKKYLMGWTGLFWCFFLFMHLVGNLATVFDKTGEALNAYAALLAGLGKALWLAEAGLVVLLLAHLILGILVTLDNWAARPQDYAVHKGKGGKTLASSTMIWTGLFVLIFAVTHLLNIKFAAHDEVMLAGASVPDIHGRTMAILENPFYVVFYILAVCLLGLHVSHGIQSAFRTIGIHGRRITPPIEKFSVVFGVLVAVGYGAMPLWAILSKGGAS
jgi:succinate dehydrogenase cytochrome b subunit